MEQKDDKVGGLLDYFLALARMEAGKPIMVSRDEPINLRSVSLEAGRKGDSIKRSRPQFAALIAAIELAAAKQEMPKKVAAKKAADEKAKLARIIVERDGAIAREISLLHEVFHLKSKLKELTGGNVFPLRPASDSISQS